MRNIATNESGEEAPIACNLDARSLGERLRWIVDLNARALRASRQSDLHLELEYDLEALSDVRRLIAQEKACCAFLAFNLKLAPDTAKLTITVPESAREAAADLFGPLRSKQPLTTATYCCP